MKHLATLHNAYIARGICYPYSATRHPLDALCEMLSWVYERTGEEINADYIRETRRWMDEEIDV